MSSCPQDVFILNQIELFHKSVTYLSLELQYREQLTDNNNSNSNDDNHNDNDNDNRQQINHCCTGLPLLLVKNAKNGIIVHY